MRGRRVTHARHKQNLRGIILLPFEYFEGPRYKLPMFNNTNMQCFIFETVVQNPPYWKPTASHGLATNLARTLCIPFDNMFH